MKFYTQFASRLLFLLLFVGMSVSNSMSTEIPDSNDCFDQGVLLKFINLDGCGPIIQSLHGQTFHILNPDAVSGLNDSAQVKFGYRAIDSAFTICMNGMNIELTCIEPIDTPFCSAKFEHYPVDCISSIDSIDCGGYLIGFVPAYDSLFQSFFWEFGDGSSSDLPYPVHAYEEAGEYDVCLTVEGENDCYDRYCQTVVVGTVDTTECHSAFRYVYDGPLEMYDTILYDTAGLQSIQFYELASDNTIEYHWDFGDGIYSSEANPRHIYYEPGEYIVSLSIRAINGCTDTHSATIIIEGSTNCEAYFEHCKYSYSDSTSHRMDSAAYVIGFKNLSKGEWQNVFWDFGDGTNSDHASPVHKYKEAGTYWVCLEVYGWACQSSYCAQIVVGDTAECQIDFNIETLVPDCSGYYPAYSFSSEALSNANSFYWDLGDGSISYEINPVHMYDVYGTFEVCLYADFDTCQAKSCANIYAEYEAVDSIFQKSCKSSSYRPEEGMAFSLEGIYPQPASTTIQIELTSAAHQLTNIYLVNLLGEKIQLEKDYEIVPGKNQLNIDVEAFKEGLYIYYIESSGNIIQGQLLIAR